MITGSLKNADRSTRIIIFYRTLRGGHRLGDSRFFRQCVHEYQKSGTEQYSIERISYLLIRSKDCTGAFLHRNGEAVTAIFTVILAISTIHLWLSTRKLWESGKSQLELARAEFNATHRPCIVVRDVVKDGNNIYFLLVNKGESPATIVESWVIAEFVAEGQAMRPLRSAGHDSLGKIHLAVGEVRDLTYQIPEKTLLAFFYPGRKVAGPDGPSMFGLAYFAGTIVYVDADGHRRRTVFRRMWNGKSGGFERLKNPDYEYED